MALTLAPYWAGALTPGGHAPAWAAPQAHARVNLLVGYDSHAQLGQLEDLPGLDDFVRLHLQLTDAALGGPLMGYGLIDCSALAQGVARVALLPAVGALTRRAQ